MEEGETLPLHWMYTFRRLEWDSKLRGGGWFSETRRRLFYSEGKTRGPTADQQSLWGEDQQDED